MFASLIRVLTAPIRLFGRSRAFRWLLGAVVVLGLSFYAALWALERFLPPGDNAAILADLKPPPPLKPVARDSFVITPMAIAIPAIRDAIDKAAPRELIGKNDNPVSALLSAADVGIKVSRGPIAMAGQPDELSISAPLNGSLKVTGELATQAGNLVGGLTGLLEGALKDGGGSSKSGSGTKDDNPIGGLISGLFGKKDSGGSKSGGSDNSTSKKLGEGTTKALDQRVDVRGLAIVHSRPALTANWRVKPNLTAQLDLSQSSAQIAGLDINMTEEAKPLINDMVNQQIGNMENWLSDAPFVEQIARVQWTKMCRAIPLGGGETGLPQLWLEIRPVRAAAAQPRIDPSNVTMTVGVLAETRISSAETKPQCPFPKQLELTAPMDDGRLKVALPIDVPFTTLSELMEAQLKGKTFPEDGSGPAEVEVQHVHLAASGQRLLVSLDVKAREKKSWFGFGARATVHVWGKPVLDADSQILRLTEISLAVESQAAFGLLSRAARAAIPYVQQALAEKAVVDLKPFALDAQKKIGIALQDFRRQGQGVDVDAAIQDIRLTGIEFDAKTLRVIAEADGAVRVAVSHIPQM